MRSLRLNGTRNIARPEQSCGLHASISGCLPVVRGSRTTLREREQCCHEESTSPEAGSARVSRFPDAFMCWSLSENGSRRREEADFRRAVGARVRLVTSAHMKSGVKTKFPSGEGRKSFRSWPRWTTVRRFVGRASAPSSVGLGLPAAVSADSLDRALR
jgi:hypothetical protein